MRVLINVDELRSISSLAVNASEKMRECNGVIETIVSKHDWKCPERVAIDESLENIKSNALVLSEAFVDFSLEMTQAANDYTDFINEQKLFDSRYMDDVAKILAESSFMGTPTTISSGNNIGGVVNELESTSLDTFNVASLHGANHGISIMDFSLFLDE